MTCLSERHAIIIGGGASGVLLAYQLLQHPASDFRVTLIEKHAEIGRGLVAYDAEEAEKIKGRSSPDVMTILGISGRAEMIHRDDLVVGGARSADPA